MEECKICSKELKSNRALSRHVSFYHDMGLLEYKIKHENFLIPKCEVCGKDAKLRKSISFQKSCGDKKCIETILDRKTVSEETREKIRKKRLAYMKANPSCTAWRTGNEMSWPEKVFINAVKRHGWYDKFEITREKSFYPYFVDFAFENVKVAVEIDGGQHEQAERKASDDKKDTLLITQGWRVYRVKAKQVLSDVNSIITDLEQFIGEIDNISKTCELLTGKEKKMIEVKIGKEKRQRETQKIIDKRGKTLESVDKNNFGWLQRVADIWGLSHTQTKRWIKKYHPEVEYYQRKDYTPIE